MEFYCFVGCHGVGCFCESPVLFFFLYKIHVSNLAGSLLMGSEARKPRVGLCVPGRILHSTIGAIGLYFAACLVVLSVRNRGRSIVLAFLWCMLKMDIKDW